MAAIPGLGVWEGNRTFRVWPPPGENTWGAPDKECAGLRALPWTFQGLPRRRKNRPSRDTTTTPSVPASGALPQGTQKWGAWGPTWEDDGARAPLTLLLALLQMLQRLCGRVQEEVRALRLCPLEPVQDELLYARDLIKDAKNSRAVRALRSNTPPPPPPQIESPGRPTTLPQEYPGPDPCICPPSPGPRGTRSGPVLSLCW